MSSCASVVKITNMKINDLFGFIGECQLLGNSKSGNIKGLKKSIYATIREILKARRALKFRNDVDAMLDNYEALTDYFVRNYSASKSDVHIRNLEIIHDIFYDLAHDVTDDDDDSEDEDYTNSESDEDNTNDDDCDQTSEDLTEGAICIEEVCSCITDQSRQQHEKTRWLIGAHFMLTLANIAISSVALYRVISNR
jgi:hypothetical protein